MAINMLVEDPSYNGVATFVNNAPIMTFESPWFCSTSTWFASVFVGWPSTGPMFHDILVASYHP